MQIFNNVADMQKFCISAKKQGKTIGLVPTMGFLHAGHLGLVDKACAENDIVVVSIFVNPMQFGVGEDYEEYPRDLSKDSALLIAKGVTACFAPLVKEMYPSDYSTFTQIEGAIGTKLCGQSRPTHFRGVTTVVNKLFNICQPDRAYFGQKDAQQVILIEKMVRELNIPLEIVRGVIVREADGLAMSSRNVYLTTEQRQQALVLNRSLQEAKAKIEGGEKDIKLIRDSIIELIATSPEAEIDYVEILNGENLNELLTIEGQVLIAIAVKFGTTRLLDNLLMEA